MNKMWDHRQCRTDFVRPWYRARAQQGADQPGSTWSRIHGPVGAARLHLHRTGAAWPKPFTLQALGHDINILGTPPKQVMAVLRAQARRHEDILLLARLARRRSWNLDAILVEYVHGIDWWLLRRMLARKVGDRTPPERRILAVVASGGFWPEDRRYQCGYRDSSLCEACMLEVGTGVHRIHDCGAMSNDLIFAVAAGHLPRLPRDARKPALAPLLEMGLPPRPEPWQPIDGSYEDGHLTMDADQWVCGDGSGYHQQVLEARVATWAVVKKGRDANGKPTVAETFRGTVDGWYPTVPRGELSALNAHLRHAGLGSTYVGDCRHVLEGAEKGVPRPLTSSANINADLWRITRQLLDDHGGGVKVRKT